MFIDTTLTFKCFLEGFLVKIEDSAMLEMNSYCQLIVPDFRCRA